MKQNRWQSYALWGALAAQLLSILVLAGALTPTQSEGLNAVVIGILQMLVAFGVINSPTTKGAL